MEKKGENFHNFDEGPVNILRERTFNKELQDLITRVTDEKIESDERGVDHPLIRNLDQVTDRELLIRLHTLYYKIRYLEETKDADISINTASLEHGMQDQNFKDGGVTLFNEYMQQSGYPFYCLLSYDFYKRSFVPYYSTMDYLTTTNIALSMRDNLFDSIVKNIDGIVLKREEIGSDPFLSKLFGGIGGGGDLYFVFIDYLYQSLIRDGHEGKVSLNYNFSTILIVQLSENQALEKNLLQIFSERVGLSAMLMDRHSLVDFQKKIPNEQGLQFNILEYLFLRYEKLFPAVGFFISLKTFTKECFHVLSYLAVRLQKDLDPPATLLTNHKNRLLVFAAVSQNQFIISVINEFNGLFPGNFIYRSFDPGFVDSNQIIKDFLL